MKKANKPIIAEKEEDINGIGELDTTEAPIAVNRRGRHIRLPQRYRDSEK